MTPREDALLRVGIAAALADGTCNPDERRHIERLATAAGLDAATTLAQGATDTPDLAIRLHDAVGRKAAYDFAVAVCNADGVTNDAERRFLDGLRAELELPEAVAMHELATAGALASAPVAGGPLAAETASTVEDLVLQHAVLAGALELLPQSLANLAVIPVQLRMVYLIGQRHGMQLDAAQAKDMLGTFGLGAATQVLDGITRRVLGGVASGLLGTLLGGAAGGVAGVGTVFAATYALGQAAEQYYAQGRRLGPDDLRALFARLREEAQGLYPKVRAQIEERAETLDLQQVIAMLGGR